MQLPQTAEYALRAMTCIALNGNNKPISAKKLADTSNIPVHYLSKILRKLVTAGFISSKKGHGGGFALAKEADEINFRDILETVDYQVSPSICVFGWSKCGSDNPCPLHNSWSSLKESFSEWADSKTLLEIIQNSESLYSCSESKSLTQNS